MSCVTLKFQGWPWTGHVFYDTSSFVHNFIAICEVETGVSVQKSPNLGKISFELFHLAFWPLTLTFCMDITFVNDNYFWKFHDDTMTQTAKKLWRTDGRMERWTEPFIELLGHSLKKQGQSEGFDSCDRPSNISQVGFISTYYVKLCASFQIHWWIQTGVTVRKHSIPVKIGDFFVWCDLQIWWMTLKNNRAPLLSNICVHHFITICEFKLELRSGNS